MMKLFNIQTATAAFSLLLVINSIGLKSAQAQLPSTEFYPTQSSTILAQSLLK